MSQNKISPQSKSFLILCGFAVVGIYVCLFLLRYIEKPQNNWYAGSGESSGYSVISHPLSTLPTPTPTPTPAVDTSAWKTFTSQQYGFSFLYNPVWNILPATKKNGFVEIQVDPGKKFYNFKITIDPNQFNVNGLASMTTTTETIGDQSAINYQGILFCVKNGGYYFTFDMNAPNSGASATLTPEFDAMVRSVTFQ